MSNVPFPALPTGDRCPTGCGRRRRPYHLMCATCWREVPRFVQREVLTTWRRLRRNHADPGALRAYRAAVNAALGSIR